MTSISDFYISHGQLFQSTYSDRQRGGDANFPDLRGPAGLLIFDGGRLDMFKIDRELMVLRADAIPAAQEAPRDHAPRRSWLRPIGWMQRFRQPSRPPIR